MQISYAAEKPKFKIKIQVNNLKTAYLCTMLMHDKICVSACSVGDTMETTFCSIFLQIEIILKSSIN